MSNFLQPVLDLYPKFSIEKQKSPSYVEMFTKKIEDIVMVYLKVMFGHCFISFRTQIGTKTYRSLLYIADETN